MNQQQAIEEAKNLCQVDFIANCKRNFIRNYSFPITWARQELKDNAYVLNCQNMFFVFVIPAQKEVIAARRNREKINSFFYEDK